MSQFANDPDCADGPLARRWSVHFTPVPLQDDLGMPAVLAVIWNLDTDLLVDATTARDNFEASGAVEDLVDSWLDGPENPVLVHFDDDCGDTAVLRALLAVFGHDSTTGPAAESRQRDTAQWLLTYPAEDWFHADFDEFVLHVEASAAILSDDPTFVRVFDIGWSGGYGDGYEDLDTDPTGQTAALNPVGRVRGSDNTSGA